MYGLKEYLLQSHISVLKQGQDYLHIWVNWFNFLQVMWVTESNEMKPDKYILKMATKNSEYLSTSDCHSSEHKSMLLVLDTYLKE